MWRDGALYFCTGPGEQKALNLRTNGQCVLTTGDNRWKAGLDVVVEGRAEQVTDDALLHALACRWCRSRSVSFPPACACEAGSPA